jgi:GTP-binding protein
VEEGNDPEKFRVSGRGELHLSILLENMRREGYELAVSRPEVIFREIDGQICEPYEQLTVDLEEGSQGAIMQALGERKGELKDMVPDGKGRVRLDYEIPSRGLIGFQTEFMTLTSGTGLKHHVFDHYGPANQGGIAPRRNGAMISNAQGKVLGYALFNLQERGRMLVSPGDEVYEGQVVGIHSRDNDLVVNPLKAKQLTNIRAAGSDENILLTPPVKLQPGAGAGVHRGRRAGRGHPERHPHPQALPEGARAQARRPKPRQGILRVQRQQFRCRDDAAAAGMPVGVAVDGE